MAYSCPCTSGRADYSYECPNCDGVYCEDPEIEDFECIYCDEDFYNELKEFQMPIEFIDPEETLYTTIALDYKSLNL